MQWTVPWRSVCWADEVGTRSSSVLQVVEIVAEREGEPGCSGHDARYADHRADTDQDIDDLVGGCSCTHRGIGLFTEGRFGCADRHQCCEPGKRQSLPIETCGVHPKADVFVRSTCLGVPRAVTSPPRSPAPGPKSKR